MIKRLLLDRKQSWNRVILCSFYMVFGLFFSSFVYADWNGIQYSSQIKDGDLKTSIQTDHQGEHKIHETRAYMEDKLLTIRFPAQLPAYWGGMNIQVDQEKGVFQAKAGGIPFVGENVTHRIVYQSLQLQKKNYNINDKINGDVEIIFEEYGQVTDYRRQFYFKGKFSGIVRDEQYDAISDKNIEGYDLKTALYELGKPVCIDTVDFGYYNDGVKKQALLPVYEEAGIKGCLDEKDKPPKAPKKVVALMPKGRLETIAFLSWDISPEAQVSDGGQERLTIWYRLDENQYWHQLGFKKWQRSMK